MNESHSARQRRYPQRQCPQCGALVEASAAVCWLCGAKSGSSGAGEAVVWAEIVQHDPAQDAATGAPTRTDHVFRIMLWIFAAACGLVFIGIVATNPGLAVLMAVSIVPVIIRTLRIQRANQTAVRPSAGNKLVTFLISGLVTYLALFAGAVAAVATCIAAVIAHSASGQNWERLSRHEEWIMGLIFTAAVLAIGLVFYLFRNFGKQYR